MRAQPARVEPRPPGAEWSEEDILFVVSDVLEAAPDDFGDRGFEIARAVLKESLGAVEKIQIELGHPDGFQPTVYALIHARGAFGALWAYTTQLENAEAERDQQIRLNRLLALKIRALESVKGQ